MRIKITNTIFIEETEIEYKGIRSSGPGGQNVNKVATGIHLRFDILNSDLSDYQKNKIITYSDQRISKEGVINIKATEYRVQEKNKDVALARFRELMTSIFRYKKKRIKTKPSKSSQEKRMDGKTKKSQVKTLRKKIDF